MDSEHALIAMAVAVGRKRVKTRRMKAALRVSQAAVQEKRREREMLLRMNQGMLSQEVRKQKLLKDCLFFIEAIENNDLEIAQNFDEKAIMEAILTFINCNGGCGGDKGGTSGDQGGSTDNAQ